MAPDPALGRRSVSPESSGRNSPIPRQWRNQLGGEDALLKDKTYRRYAAGVDKALTLFETALEEWADYISFLNRLLKSLQARPSKINAIPSKATVAKRLSQCLNPSLPSGVHQKALEVYNHIFATIGNDGLSRDLPLYLPGLAPTLSFASLSVRSPYLDILEQYFLQIDRRSLRPAMKSMILALLPGLEDETAEDFERTLKLMTSFKGAIRGPDSELLSDEHASDDDYFWQCFFLASVTSNSRRGGALAYLVRHLPTQGLSSAATHKGPPLSERAAAVVTSPEPGLLVRCFASGLCDEQLLIQRGFLDLLVTHIPLNSDVLQSRVKPDDLELLLRAAIGVVTRRDMSLNRRLWAWFLGPEPQVAEPPSGADSTATVADQQGDISSRTKYFEEYGLQPLTSALLGMIRSGDKKNTTERARPYRICLSLMDRWEIGGLVVPEVFLPVIENVRAFKSQASSKAEFSEVLKSARVFFDGIESGLIYGEIVTQLSQALSSSDTSVEERNDKLALISFILNNFNVREEEMITVHAPLTCLASLAMLEDAKSRYKPGKSTDVWETGLADQALSIATSLLELVPDRAFADATSPSKKKRRESMSNADVSKRIQTFYIQEQGNIETAAPPFGPFEMGELLLYKMVKFICATGDGPTPKDRGSCVRILILALAKMPASYNLDVQQLLSFLHLRLQSDDVPFTDYSSIVQLGTELHDAGRIKLAELSELVPLLVRHAWKFLSASEPKYHVETVRWLWRLQSALPQNNRDIEAALASIIVEPVYAASPARAADKGRTFGVLWSHTLQDSTTDRRPSKVQGSDVRSGLRLAGAEHFDIMLTRPLFLILDALFDEEAPLFMTARSWLTTMLGTDRLFLVLVLKFSELHFFKAVAQPGDNESPLPDTMAFSEDDDLDICLYYVRVLFNVLRHSGDVSWSILASKHLSFTGPRTHISTGGEESDMTLQDFFVRICISCIVGDASPTASPELKGRVSQVHRFALLILHQLFLSEYAVPLSHMNLEHLFLGRLLRTIETTDSYVQILLLDVIHDTLRLREAAPAEQPLASPTEKRAMSMDPISRNSRPSLSASDVRTAPPPPPPILLKCLQAGLSSATSRPVLDSWIAFLTECLPYYADSIFQVVIPLVETFCKEIGSTFSSLSDTFRVGTKVESKDGAAPESTLIYLLNGLEQVLARSHDQLISEEARAQLMKNPDQPQSLFGSMVSGVFQSDAHQSRSATANDRLTVHLAFQDATRMCYRIWSWGLGHEAAEQDPASMASFNYTCLRTRNRARRLLEHLFTAETLECLETVIDLWKNSEDASSKAEVFNLLSALEASRPRHSMPALFNSIYSRTNPAALEPSRKSTMTISLEDTTLVNFLVEYARSLDDDAMDEIWQDCMIFLKDLLSNPFPHRQNLASLLDFAAILGGKVDNTTFGEQRKMRRELGDLFLRLLAALFTTRPMTFSESSTSLAEKTAKSDGGRRNTLQADGPEDVVGILAAIVPNLQKILLEPDRVLSAAGTISTSVISPTLRAKGFPDTVSQGTLNLLRELSRLANNQKTWKKDVGEAFNDARFFSMDMGLVEDGWLPLLKQWTMADKEKMPDIVGRINAPTTAGIVFGVGATSARLEADRKTQVNLRRIATLILSSAEDTFVSDMSTIFDKLVELLAATATSSPSSTTRADIYMVIRALVLKTSPIHLAMFWPVVNAELHAALSSVVAPDHSSHSDVYTNTSILQACKLLDLLICTAPDDFQLHEWLFITDTIDAVYRSSSSHPVALADELSEELGSAALQTVADAEAAAHLTASSSHRRPLIGGGGIGDDVSIERRDELVAKILRPFFGQLSIFAFESTYSMGVLDWDACLQSLLKDVFDDRTIARAV